MILLLVLSLFGAVSSCSDSGSFAIDYLKIDDVVKVKVPTNIEAAGTFNKAITSGTVNVVVKYGWLKVVDRVEDFCGFIGCPVSGYTVAKKEFTIPGSAPTGGYTIKLEAFDQDKALIFCVSGSFTLKKGKSIPSSGAQWNDIYDQIIGQ